MSEWDGLVKIRRLSNDERPLHSFPLQEYAFEASPGPADRTEAYRSWLPYNQGNRTLAAEDNGETVAVASAIPMRQNVRGVVTPMAGIAGVATHPLARRRGHVRALLHQLLDEMRDEGNSVSALYPFRPSFYERFGFIGLIQPRTARFTPRDLDALLRIELPGEVTWQRVSAGYPEYRAFTERCLSQRHGFALFPDYRDVRLRDEDNRWLVTARRDGDIVGMVTYRIDGHAGELVCDSLLAADPLGRALLLQFFARHVDQVERVSVRVPVEEIPELWATDLAVRTEAVVTRPDASAPMARLLSLDVLNGLPAGPGRVRVELLGDRYLAGAYVFDGTTGQLEVQPATPTTPAPAAATLTAAGLSGLVYGVLDPLDVVVRGHGSVGPDAAIELRHLFPRESPYLFSEF